jgi:hypothetical protein
LFKFGYNDIWTISGGEPTLSQFFCDIIDFCYNISPHIIVYSNGRTLSKIPWKTFSKIERVIVPVYGNEETHNNYVNSPHAYRETMNSLQQVISRDNAKIDIKLMILPDKNTESILSTKEWDVIKENRHFSVTRVISPDFSICSDSVASRACQIIQDLIALGKNIRFYDTPVCLFQPALIDYLSNLQVDKQQEFDPIVVCGSSQKQYKLFKFDKQTDCMSGCRDCKKQYMCSMIMQNYFCPMITPEKLVLTTE